MGGSVPTSDEKEGKGKSGTVTLVAGALSGAVARFVIGKHDH
jgi:hypothetical protein